MKVTVFGSKKTQSKIPQSPFDDNTFEFETKNVNSIKEVYSFLTRNFMLNIPLHRNIKTYRRKRDLKDYFVKKIEYLVIDIDHVKSISDKELVLKFFRELDYSCILGESRNPLNLKGILEIQPCTQKQAKGIIDQINEKIKEYGDFDYSVLGYGTYQAPTLKFEILHENYSEPYPCVQEINNENNIDFENETIFQKLPISAQSARSAQSIQDLCRTEFQKQGFIFHNIVDSFIKVSHPSEKKSPKGFRWYSNNPFQLHHWNTKRNVNIWDIVVKTSEYKKIIKDQSIHELKEIMPSASGVDCTINKRYLSNCSNDVSIFLESKKILKIQSPMGTGKSTILEEVIKQSNEKSLRILFITNRVSLADDISNKYNNIKHYQGNELENNSYEIGDNLVCQIDSLWKFSTKYFDVIILDEFSTLINQLLDLEINDKKQKKYTSNTKHTRNIVQKFFSLKKKKIVIADAIIFDKQVELFANKSEIQEIINGYRDNIELEFFSQKDNFIYDLIETAKHEPVTFSSGSTIMLKVVQLLLNENNISSKIVSSETTKDEKEIIYRSLKKEKPTWQVLMYSPTITVGVSNLNKVSIHYHYDTGNSVDVLASLQMTKRTRSVSTIKLFLAGRQKYSTTNISQIKYNLRDYSLVDDDGDIIGITEIGEKLAVLIQIHNVLENVHKESFKLMLKYQFLLNGNIKKNTTEVPTFIYKTSKLVKKQEQDKKLDIFDMYRNMTPEQVSEIEMKVFGTTKEEEHIKMFEFWKNNENLKNLTEDDINTLIKEEIVTPGTIQNYIKIQKEDINLPDVISKRTYNANEIFKIKNLYTKDKNRYRLNKVIKELL